MKTRLGLFTTALVIYVVGLFSTISISFGVGAILVLSAGAMAVVTWASLLYTSYRNKSLRSVDVFASILGLIVLAEIFVQGYSIAISKSLLSIPSFFKFHIFAGVALLGLFAWITVREANKITIEKNRYMLFIIVAITTVISFMGYLGLAGIVHGTVRFIYYAYVFLTFAYLLYVVFVPKQKEDRAAFWTTFGIVFLMVVYWILRWQIPNVIVSPLHRAAIQLGFVVVIVLPVAIAVLKKNHFLFPYLFYVAITELYFIGYSKEFKYLADVGIRGCVGYESAANYPANPDPGIAMAELLRPPQQNEIDSIRQAWRTKDFTPRNIRLEYTEQQRNGDSINVISHDVNGAKHYGLIRIPAGLDTRTAPILLVLHGGGADVDVLETDLLSRIASASCRDLLNHYIVIAPSFRGDIARGKNFCFRSEGYTGDVWAGAAEDAVFFLEAVKKIYHKDSTCHTIAFGISRGATVALIVSGLTEKITHAIAVSTHADFLNQDVYEHEKVGRDFAKIFFTPPQAPDAIRTKLITSSPLYFAEYIPSFEIHQGTLDDLTTVRHTNAIKSRLQKLQRDGHAQFYIYEGKGHGYDDDRTVCASLTRYTLKNP